MSFPSQNPYTDRRPDEPRMPRGMEWSMLSKDEKERLRGLAKEHAENIGLHILAAYTLLDEDPDAAMEHAKWVARQASRIDFSRETLAFVAYRQGDYKLALREFRTAYRMNGFTDYLPFIADCERGLGDPKKALQMAQSDEGKALQGEAKAEMFLVYAGALADLGVWDKAIDVVSKLADSKGLPGAYRMRALQAEQYFLEESGHGDQAADIDPILDKLEERYADEDEDEQDEDVVIDYDLEELPPAVMEKIGITWDDAAYAPEEQKSDEPEGSQDPDGSSAAAPSESAEDTIAEEASPVEAAEIVDTDTTVDAGDAPSADVADAADAADVSAQTADATEQVGKERVDEETAKISSGMASDVSTGGADSEPMGLQSSSTESDRPISDETSVKEPMPAKPAVGESGSVATSDSAADSSDQTQNGD